MHSFITYLLASFCLYAQISRSNCRKWPYSSPSAVVTTENWPVPPLTYKPDRFKEKIRSAGQKELNMCVQGVNWKFAGAADFELAPTAYLAVKDVLSQLNGYLLDLNRTLRYVADNQRLEENCFAVLHFTRLPVLVDNVSAYTDHDDYITVKALGHLDDPVRWYKLIGRQVGHILGLDDDDAQPSLMNKCYKFSHQLIYSRDVFSLSTIFRYVNGQLPADSLANLTYHDADGSDRNVDCSFPGVGHLKTLNPNDSVHKITLIAKYSGRVGGNSSKSIAPGCQFVISRASQVDGNFPGGDHLTIDPGDSVKTIPVWSLWGRYSGPTAAWNAVFLCGALLLTVPMLVLLIVITKGRIWPYVAVNYLES